jgi:ribosomal protein S18 acetylase RimI-like enzyme
MKFVPTIRSAIKRDAPYLLDIDIKSYDHAWLPEDWGLVWEDQDSSIWVAIVYGQPVGFIVTEREDYEGKLLNHIYKIAVKGQFRGSNIGRMLLARAYQEAKETGMNYLSIAVPMSMTLEKNPRYCLPWLQKMEFKAVDTLPNNTSLWGQKEDIIIFEFKVK